jgi:phage terminase small subunit
MPELLNPRWERFCRHYLASGNQSEAFKRAGYKTDDNGSNSTRLLKNPCIKQRLLELRAKAYYAFDLERRDLTGFLGAVVATPAGELTPDHPLAQSYQVDDKGVKVRMPDKVAAAQALARIQGYDAPQQLEVTVNPLTSYLRTLRGAKTIESGRNVAGQSDLTE